MDAYNLQRFLDAQENSYEYALSEVRQGCKRTHWIWYVFPQIKGLGSSYRSNYYGISSIGEAKEYLLHPILGLRLREIATAFLQLENQTASNVFGDIDAKKVQSCMTLFSLVAGENLFKQTIEKYYGNTPDRATIQLLNNNN